MRKKYSYFISAGLIAAFALILISVIHVVLVQDSTQKFVVSLLQDYRREILSGDKTFAIRALQKKISDENGIVEISYTSPGYPKRFIADSYKSLDGRSIGEYFQLGILNQDLYFDSKKTDRAMSFEFYYYRFSNFGVSFAAWTAFCAILVLVLFKFYGFEKKNEEIRSSFERAASISRIVQMLSHDMRAPLGTIENLLHIDGETFLRRREVIRSSLNRLHAMIESLRYSEAEVIVKRSLQSLDFSAGIEGLRIKAAERNLTMVLPQDGLIWAWIDQTKFERAWLNLVSNAIDVARSMIAVEIEWHAEDLLIRVKDDGPGVPREIQGGLFRRGVTHGKAGGTGLGLAYVRQIMRGHGGDVTYRRENDMTVFECCLPNVVVEKERTDNVLTGIQSERISSLEIIKPSINQVSICFQSTELNHRILDRLSKITQSTYVFIVGFDQKSTIVLTDSEETAEKASEVKARPILMSSLSDDEIVRRAPIRLGIRG